MSCLTAAVHVALGRLCHALSWSWVGRNFHACNEASWAGPSSAICPWPKLSSSTACLKISFLRSFESIDLKNNTRQIFNFPKHVCFWPLSGYHMASRLPLYILILGRPGHWDIDVLRLAHRASSSPWEILVHHGIAGWNTTSLSLKKKRIRNSKHTYWLIKLSNWWTRGFPLFATVHFIPVVFHWYWGRCWAPGETHGKFFGSTRFSFLTQTNSWHQM